MRLIQVTFHNLDFVLRRRTAAIIWISCYPSGICVYTVGLGGLTFSTGGLHRTLTSLVTSVDYGSPMYRPMPYIGLLVSGDPRFCKGNADCEVGQGWKIRGKQDSGQISLKNGGLEAEPPLTPPSEAAQF